MSGIKRQFLSQAVELFIMAQTEGTKDRIVAAGYEPNPDVNAVMFIEPLSHDMTLIILDWDTVYELAALRESAEGMDEFLWKFIPFKKNRIPEIRSVIITTKGNSLTSFVQLHYPDSPNADSWASFPGFVDGLRAYLILARDSHDQIPLLVDCALLDNYMHTDPTDMSMILGQIDLIHFQKSGAIVPNSSTPDETVH